MYKTDSQLQEDVLDELKWDTRVDETHVGVVVENGIVTLTGTASGWAKKVAAQDAAFRVAGVHDVANDIKIKPIAPTAPSDTEIAEAVRRALVWDVFVPEAQIQTTVWDGIVTLRGEVDWTSQREDAARAIENLTGVRTIQNDITIRHPVVPATTLHSSIEEALTRRAGREAKRIHFDVRDKEVTLSGTVTSWAEREAIIGAARGTPGVESVIDQLQFA